MYLPPKYRRQKLFLSNTTDCYLEKKEHTLPSEIVRTVLVIAIKNHC